MGMSAATTEAALFTFSSILAPEVPGATGTGKVLVTFDDIADTLAIEADFSGLSGTTTVAHIHCCVSQPGTGTVGVAVTPGTLPGFPTGVSAGSYSITLDLTLSATYTSGFLNNFGGGTAAGAQAALLAAMGQGQAYFNVHTNNFPGGEIRGFLAPVPEPTTLALLGSGIAGLAFRRRRT
jgi:hypothetical protein